VRVLAHDLPDSQVALQLNKEGVTSAKGTGFTRSVVSWIRYAHNIPVPVLKLPGELTVNEIAKKLGVSLHVVYYWIEHHVVQARRPPGGARYYISLDPEKERELAQWVAESGRIPKRGSLNHTAGGAV
jgi:excisionase family DNA binding protein